MSWAGSGSHQITLVLRQWLPEVLRSLQPLVALTASLMSIMIG